MNEPKKLQLANTPTPLIKSQFRDCKFLIKRDDFTGVELSGNKIRKLEYLLYEAKIKKCNYVFTSGGDQSNHARATAIAAASLGIKTKLFLWGRKTKSSEGNLFLDKIVNSEISFLSRKEYNDVPKIMDAEKIKYERKGNRVFVIPSGGSSPLGIWGYVSFMKELSEQIDLNKLKGITLAAGSAGTAAGILVGSTILGNDLKIYAVNVIYSAEVMKEKIITLAKQCIQNYKIDVLPNYNNIEILDGYSNEGYKNVTPQKISLIKNYFQESGILLDPTYTGKAFVAYYENFLKNKKSTNVLFLHTGGLFGVFAKRKNYLD
ncbi:MAG: pyridoxal-phosphate dependent enzyme [Melioribacteraceae bacterium]